MEELKDIAGFEHDVKPGDGIKLVGEGIEIIGYLKRYVAYDAFINDTMSRENTSIGLDLRDGKCWDNFSHTNRRFGTITEYRVLERAS